jgi:hypothetical protein
MAAEGQSPTELEGVLSPVQEPPASRKRGPDDDDTNDAAAEVDAPGATAASPKPPLTPGRDLKRRKGSQSQQHSQAGEPTAAAAAAAAAATDVGVAPTAPAASRPGTRASSRRASVATSGVATTAASSSGDEEDNDGDGDGDDMATGASPPRVYARDGLQFKVPRYVRCAEEPQGGVNWIREFVELNAELASRLTTALMADALGEHCAAAAMSRKKRKSVQREFAQAIKTVPLDELPEADVDRKIRTSFWRRRRGEGGASARDGEAQDDATQDAAAAAASTSCRRAASPRASSRAVMYTSAAPKRTQCSATARPSPVVPPTTHTAWPAKEPGGGSGIGRYAL